MTSPEEFIDFAASLIAVNSNPSGAAIRTAADRAYYGAFHACIAFEKSLPLIGRLSHRPGGEHENLMQRLERPDPKLHLELQAISKELSTSLRQLKEDRVTASYRLDATFPLSQAEVTVLEARAILKKARQGEDLRKKLGVGAKQ